MLLEMIGPPGPARAPATARVPSLRSFRPVGWKELSPRVLDKIGGLSGEVVESVTRQTSSSTSLRSRSSRFAAGTAAHPAPVRTNCLCDSRLAQCEDDGMQPPSVCQTLCRSCVKFSTNSGEKVWKVCGKMGKGLEGPKSHDSWGCFAHRLHSSETGTLRAVFMYGPVPLENSACVAGVHTPAKPVCGRHVAGTVVLYTCS